MMITGNDKFNKSAIALPAALTGVAAISFGSIFVRLSGAELNPYAIAFYRLLLATIVFAVWNGGQALYQRWLLEHSTESTPPESRTLGLACCAGALWTATLTSMFWALTQTSIAITVALHNLAPIFTSLGAWLLFGQTFDRRFVMGVGVAIVGVTLIELEEIHIDIDRLQGDLAALLSAIFLAAYLLVVERLRTEFSAAMIQLWVCGIGSLTSLPLLFLFPDHSLPQTANGWFVIVSLVFVCQVLGHGLLTFSLAKLSSVSVSLVHLLEPVFSSIFAWFIFWEQLSFWSWIGFAVILVGLYLTVSSHASLVASQDSNL